MKKFFIILTNIILIFLISSCNSVKTYECNPFSVFDTIITMTFYDCKDYKNYYNEIKKKFNEIDKLCNDYSKTELKNVYDLNIEREIEENNLKDILVKALELKSETNGYFNPFIGRLSHLWKDAINDNRVLNDDLIESEINIMNNTSLVFENNKIKLIGEGNIDLGAIAKGYALEWAKSYLEENNVTKYYINCGSSSIYISDYELNVSLSKPYNNDSILEFKTKNNGIGTSSPKYQYKLIDGIKYHHILNPFTGKPSLYYDSVNVIGKDNLRNDVYSTAIFNMDLDMAKDFSKNKDINIILFKDNKIVYQKDEL